MIMQAPTTERLGSIRIDILEAISVTIEDVLAMTVYRLNIFHLLFMHMVCIFGANLSTRMANDKSRTAHHTTTPNDGHHTVANARVPVPIVFVSK